MFFPALSLYLIRVLKKHKPRYDFCEIKNISNEIIIFCVLLIYLINAMPPKEQQKTIRRGEKDPRRDLWQIIVHAKVSSGKL